MEQAARKKIAVLAAGIGTLSLAGGIAAQFTASTTSEHRVVISQPQAQPSAQVEKAPEDDESGATIAAILILSVVIGVTVGTAGPAVLDMRLRHKEDREKHQRAIEAEAQKAAELAARHWTLDSLPKALSWRTSQPLPRGLSKQFDEMRTLATSLMSEQRIGQLDPFEAQKLRLLIDSHIPAVVELYDQASTSGRAQRQAQQYLGQQLSSITAELNDYIAQADETVLRAQRAMNSLLAQRAPHVSDLTLTKR